MPQPLNSLHHAWNTPPTADMQLPQVASSAPTSWLPLMLLPSSRLASPQQQVMELTAMVI
jgi:hypothetical protein